MDMKFQDKVHLLEQRLKEWKKVVIAFSGGKDSFFLLKHALAVLGEDNVVAVFVTTMFHGRSDERRMEYFAELLDFPIETLAVDISGEHTLLTNPKDRCYHCKRGIFQTILDRYCQDSQWALLDGTTFSDLNEYRPGLAALRELGVHSPLKTCRISSEEIVSQLQRESRIDMFYITSSTCLATRFPYNHRLSDEELRRFDDIETWLIDRGIFPVRVRYIEEGIRIETEPHHFSEVICLAKEIVNRCQTLGFKFVTLDLEGIKSGVWD